MRAQTSKHCGRAVTALQSIPSCAGTGVNETPTGSGRFADTTSQKPATAVQHYDGVVLVGAGDERIPPTSDCGHQLAVLVTCHVAALLLSLPLGCCCGIVLIMRGKPTQDNLARRIRLGAVWAPNFALGVADAIVSAVATSRLRRGRSRGNIWKPLWPSGGEEIRGTHICRITAHCWVCQVLRHNAASP